MVFSKLLLNSFEIGRENLVLKTGVLNEYAKFMQSPNIPLNGNMVILIDDDQNDQQKENIVETFGSLNDKLPGYLEKLNLNIKSISFKKKDWIHSILTFLDSNFPIYSETSKESMRKDFKCKIEESFSSTYNSKIFNEYKIKKGDLYSKCCEIEYNDAVLHVISDYLQVNVSVLNKFGYRDTCALTEDRKSIVLFETDDEIGCLLEDCDVISTTFPIIEELRSKRISIYTNKETSEKYSKVLRMTKKQLEVLAGNYSISCADKKKNEILDEITLKL